MHFDLVDLRLFLHVAEAGSITAGAEHAGLSLASASARVRGMEEQAGASLLERGHRGVELTPAGRTLLHHARLVTGQMERMRGELGEYARGLKGHVRLLANTAAAAEFLPEILAAFLAAGGLVAAFFVVVADFFAGSRAGIRQAYSAAVSTTVSRRPPVAAPFFPDVLRAGPSRRRGRCCVRLPHRGLEGSWRWSSSPTPCASASSP